VALVETVANMAKDQKEQLTPAVLKFVDAASKALTENAQEITAKTGSALKDSLSAATISISDAGRNAMEAFLAFAEKQPVMKNTTKALGDMSSDALRIYLTLTQQRQNS
jgi:hypothetical protein